MRSRIALIVLAASLAACGGDSTTSPTSASVAGSYSLRTINGAQLPFTIQDGNTRADIISDVLNITDGGTWSEVITVRLSLNGGTPQTQTGASSGSYSRVGQNLTLTDASDGSRTNITFDGNRTMTVVTQIIGTAVYTLVYTK